MFLRGQVVTNLANDAERLAAKLCQRLRPVNGRASHAVSCKRDPQRRDHGVRVGLHRVQTQMREPYTVRLTDQERGYQSRYLQALAEEPLPCSHSEMYDAEQPARSANCSCVRPRHRRSV